MPFSNGYSYRRTVTIRQDQITVGSTDLTDFPMRFAGTYSYLATVANGGKVEHASGYDIRFETLAGVKLAHAMNKWVDTTGEIDARVKTQVGATVDVVVYLYYGKAGLGATEADPAAVWDASTVAAYQLGDGSTVSVLDATANGLTLTDNGVGAVAGVVGGGISIASGSGKYLSHANDAKYNTSNYTVECWFKRTTGGSGYIAAFSHSDQGLPGHYFVYLLTTNSNKLMLDIPYVVGGVLESSVGLNTNQWYHVALTKSGNVYTLYLDGVQNAQVTNASATYATGKFAIGAIGSANFTGPTQIDEVIVSSVARAIEWIEASYKSTKASATFYTLSAEEAASQTLTGSTGIVSGEAFGSGGLLLLAQVITGSVGIVSAELFGAGGSITQPSASTLLFAEALSRHLLAYPGLSALVGTRCQLGRAFQETAKPFVVYMTLMDSQPQAHSPATMVQVMERLRFSIYANDPATARAVKNQVRKALEAFPGSTGYAGTRFLVDSGPEGYVGEPPAEYEATVFGTTWHPED